MTMTDLLWPPCAGPDDLERVEEIPLGQRGLPASTYALVARAAELWPDAPAVRFFPEAERWQEVSTRTYSQRRATEDAAREALPDGADVTATLEDGAVTVAIAGVPEREVRRALGPFAFSWRVSPA